MPKEIHKGDQGNQEEHPTRPEASDDLLVFEQIMKRVPKIMERLKIDPAPSPTEPQETPPENPQP